MINFSNSQYIHFCNNSVFFLDSVRVSLADFFFEPFSQVTSLTYPVHLYHSIKGRGEGVAVATQTFIPRMASSR